VDDELMIELDDLDVVFTEPEEISGKMAKALPMAAPMTSAAVPTMYYRGEVELTKDAGTLFDFSKTKLSPIQQMYIIGFATRGTKTGACKLAGVTYNVVNRWMEDDEFSAALQSAVEVVRDSLEEELLARAMTGSDRLLLEAVKASKPEKYNKKQSDININGTMVHTWADLAKQAMAAPSSTPAIEATYTEAEEED